MPAPGAEAAAFVREIDKVDTAGEDYRKAVRFVDSLENKTVTDAIKSLQDKTNKEAWLKPLGATYRKQGLTGNDGHGAVAKARILVAKYLVVLEPFRAHLGCELDKISPQFETGDGDDADDVDEGEDDQAVGSLFPAFIDMTDQGQRGDLVTRMGGYL